MAHDQRWIFIAGGCLGVCNAMQFDHPGHTRLLPPHSDSGANGSAPYFGAWSPPGWRSPPPFAIMTRMPSTPRAWIHALTRPRRAAALLLLLAHALTVCAVPLPAPSTPPPAEHDTITAVPACCASGCGCGDAVKKCCCCCAHEPTAAAPEGGPTWDRCTCHGGTGPLSLDLTPPAVVTRPALLRPAAPPLVGVLPAQADDADAVADAPDSPPPR